MPADNVDLDRDRRCQRAAGDLHVALLATIDREHEARAETGRLETALASRKRDIAEGRVSRYFPGGPSADPVAEIEHHLARAREEVTRVTAEVEELTVIWQARKRLADRVRAYAVKHAPRGSFDTMMTPTFSDTGRP